MGRKREVSGGTPATTALSRLGIDFGVHPYHHDPAVASYGLEAAAAERATGYVVGGISPVGQRRVLPTVLDGAATGFDRIYVSSGRRGLDISLSPLDLVAATRGSIGEISR